MNIGEVVFFHRMKSGLTRNQLAEIAGVGKTMIYNIEKGKKSFRYDSLEKIFAILNVSIKFTSPIIDQMSENEKS